MGKGRQAHLDALIIKSVLASIISEEASGHLEQFLKNNVPLDNEEVLVGGGEDAISNFKEKNPILVSIFTY